MTYKQLLEKLIKLNDSQLNMTASIHLPFDDEYYGVRSFGYTNERDCDVLDNNHPIMTIAQCGRE
ncbi:MAG: hypothetical protein U9R15_04730 [Chloroflexota bacterium]|nr:hypothetical protein [Chloroflexota bacterium]